MTRATVRRAVPADAAGIAAVTVGTWRSAYRGIVDDAFLAGRSAEDIARRWQRALDDPAPRSVVHVAEGEGGSLLGFAAGGPERVGDAFGAMRPDPDSRTGEVYAIYVLPGAQGRGLGRRLFAAVARDLAGFGMADLGVWVLEANNPARRFYERLGGTLAGRRTIRLGAQELAEVAYRWPDLGPWQRRR